MFLIPLLVASRYYDNNWMDVAIPSTKCQKLFIANTTAKQVANTVTAPHNCIKTALKMYVINKS